MWNLASNVPYRMVNFHCVRYPQTSWPILTTPLVYKNYQRLPLGGFQVAVQIPPATHSRLLQSSVLPGEIYPVDLYNKIVALWCLTSHSMYSVEWTAPKISLLHNPSTGHGTIRTVIHTSTGASVSVHTGVAIAKYTKQCKVNRNLNIMWWATPTAKGARACE